MQVPDLLADFRSKCKIIHYSLFTIHYSLFTIHYSLFTIHYSLFTIHYSLTCFLLCKNMSNISSPAPTVIAESAILNAGK
ncbi:MAG TPA: hypothetical protein ENJ11_04545 [Gammaproteobacteria bacterium]|nr:hypothetical protein [Gammaproteobacteria bacterium]